jgi:LPXTG-motif cell wall-anchored protein
MDGSRESSRTFVTALATLTLATLAFAPAALAQSAGDDQYSDPLAGDGQQQEPASPGGGGDQPSDAPAPAPAPAAPSGPDTPTSSGGPADTTLAAPQTGESLPRTGAEPVPIVAAGAVLLLAGALLRRQVLRHVTG